MNELIMQYFTSVIGVLGVLVFLTMIVVEVIKKLPLLCKIPTDLVTFVTSFIVTFSALAVYASFTSTSLYWYYFVLALFASFMVSYISMFGWKKFKNLWIRFTESEE